MIQLAGARKLVLALLLICISCIGCASKNGRTDTTINDGYVPLINGSDTNFSYPFVLTYPKNAYPTDKPRAQLITQNLTGFTGNFLVPVLGTVNDNQLWGADFGVLR